MDKFLHLTIMMALSLILSLVLGPLWAIGICLGISIVKEVYDCFKKNPTGFSWYDLLADVGGIVIGIAIMDLVS